MSHLLRTKSIDALIAASQEPGKRLAKTLGPWSLTALGIGAVIGSGIFILTGTAAAGEKLSVDSILHAPVLDLLLHGSQAVSLTGRPGAGPAITLSFLLTAFACSFAALCYAELASMIPIAGSAYTYAYATLGELVAWIIGWDLILEYAVGNIAVAIGWAGYFDSLLRGLGMDLPRWLVTDLRAALGDPALLAAAPHLGPIPIVFNLPALAIVAFITWLLVIGTKESARVNTVMVAIKVGIIALFLFVGLKYIRPELWTTPSFAPHGLKGISVGAAIIFFSYIGFDAVSTAR